MSASRPAVGLLAVGLLAALACAGAIGCAWMHDPSLGPDTKRDPKAPIDVEALAREVARVRGLKLARPIDAQPLADAQFRERLFGVKAQPDPGRPASADEAPYVGGAAHPDGDDTVGFWNAFGFVAPGVSITQAAHRVIAASVVGFYDRSTRKLYVRGAHGDGRTMVPSRPEDFNVLAHEIEHALQDENFGLRSAKVPADEALAYQALVEGDAQLAMAGVIASSSGIAGEHWVTRATAHLRALTIDEILERGGIEADEMRRAPPLLRRRMAFPYVDGMEFVGDLVRAGGLSLVDRAFAHPPRSTEQVLHPQKYVDGEGAVPVATPQAPEGWRVVSSGSMGELATSELLAQCVPRKDAAQAATGWGGDAWSLAVDGAWHVALLWSTVWDDEASAQRFEKALGPRAACLQRASLAPSVGREVLVLRDGKRVAYAQGLTDALREPAARALLALPGDPPPAERPFGPITIPPLVDPDREFTNKGEYDEEKGEWSSEPLGIRMRVPAGFKPFDPGSFELAVQDADTSAVALFRVLLQAPTEDLRLAVIKAVLKQVRRGYIRTGQYLTFAGGDHWASADGDVARYTWHSSYGAQVVIDFRPVCEGRAVTVLVTEWFGVGGAAAINRWLDALRVPGSGSPACTWLRNAPPE